MKVTDFTRRALQVRREMRDLPKNGWEHVGEGGGALWELHRGWRYAFRIVDVKIAADGKSLWIRAEPQKTATRDPQQGKGKSA